MFQTDGLVLVHRDTGIPVERGDLVKTYFGQTLQVQGVAYVYGCLGRVMTAWGDLFPIVCNLEWRQA
jgi:hypothetical protein